MSLYEMSGFSNSRFIFSSNIYALSKMNNVAYTPDDIRSIMTELVKSDLIMDIDRNMHKLQSN